jgi:hypothetical protein
MKKSVIAVGILVLTLLGWMIFWPNPASSGLATPRECVQAFFAAVKSANAVDYLKCLGEPLHGEMQRQFATPEALADYLRTQGQDLRNWTIEEPQIEGAKAIVWAEQQFSTSQKRQKIVLQQTGNAWHIITLEKAQDMKSDVPYDTHVSKVP